MKKGYILSLVMLVAVSGCCKKKKKHQNKDKEIRTEVDIPVTAGNDGIKSFFDEDIAEFTLADETGKKDATRSINEHIDAQGVEVGANDYAWINEDNKGPFKKVYFDFDAYTVRGDQEDNLTHDIHVAQQEIEKARSAGKELPVIVIDGHADHSAGSRAYNLALSEKRAKALADRMIEAGIPHDCIKIVGRGEEMPVLVNGKAVEGNREQQWPNRRDELHVIYG